MKIGQKSPEYPPGGFLRVRPKKIFFQKVQLMDISLFWDKTFVVKPTSDLKKLKFIKMGQKLVENRQNTPLEAFLGGETKYFF